MGARVGCPDGVFEGINVGFLVGVLLGLLGAGVGRLSTDKQAR